MRLLRTDYLIYSSLALISARKTAEANDVLAMVRSAFSLYSTETDVSQQLLSTHLYCACQALDLRYLEFAFKEKFNPTILTSLTTSFSAFLSTEEIALLATKIRSAIWRRLEQTTSVDLAPRWEDAFAFVSSLVLDSLATSRIECKDSPIEAIKNWRSSSSSSAISLTKSIRESFFASTLTSTSPTSEYLGNTRPLYDFVRHTLGVKSRRGDVFLGKQEATIGSAVSKIYDAVRSGEINEVLVEMMK